uniref:Uncharacterized protein n=1 Tax=Craspedostauros australis TaxID=1486917 RepID=A0A7R9ZKF4_9STRA|mmetsp:Transcript_15930/g.44042  ORF Transcript_15930/g.44042 Transcript_15930/m.44042 type:complete len:385 (+) Transcript_15930:115-1269(+)
MSTNESLRKRKLVHALRRPRCLLVLIFMLLLCSTMALIFIFWTPSELLGVLSRDSSSSSDGETADAAEDNSDLIPKAPNCTSTTRYQLQSRYCSWDRSLETCYRMFVPVLQEKPSWVFLGGYDMSQVVHYISLQWPHESLNIKSRRDPCKNIEYYKIPRRVPWTAPNATLGEGPVGYGKDHPYCTDSQRVWNVLLDVPTQQDKYVEYLVVEYARDVSIPSHVTKTTQETAALYLSNKSPEVCVANTGLHDASIVDPKTGEPLPIDVYIHNVDAYITLLARTCRHVVWVGLSAIMEDDSKTLAGTGGSSIIHGNATNVTNCQLQEYNNAVYGLVELRGRDNVYIVDVWDKSLTTSHVDKFYMTPKYYSTLARLFATLMAGPRAAS